MHYDVAGIEDYPVRIAEAFDADRFHSAAFEPFLDFLCESADMPGGSSRGDDHVVGNAILFIQRYGYHIQGLVCVQRLLDQGL